jgi:hypothetical protein
VILHFVPGISSWASSSHNAVRASSNSVWTLECQLPRSRERSQATGCVVLRKQPGIGMHSWTLEQRACAVPGVA